MYVPATGRATYPQLEAARARVLALLPQRGHRLDEKTRPAIALDIVQQLAQAGQGPQAHYACDQGVLSLALSRGIAHAGTPWLRELAWARHIHGQGQGRRVDAGAAELRPAHPARVRAVRVGCRQGVTQSLGGDQGGAAQTLWPHAPGHCACPGGPRGYSPLSADGCAAGGQWARA
jgi:hypothetical protein